MSRFISDKLRLLVAERADFACEYCLVHQSNLVMSGQIDHILSLRHGGLTVLENLAYSCAICNNNKGYDIGSILSDGTISRFFNPREQYWSDHFEISNGLILPKTPVGEVTVRIFQFNSPEQVDMRLFLAEKGLYPRGNAHT
ncbi:MAG: HNH endonuclease [Saprospiraceae bacterium]|nr:HNH endonuclease [Saprospiraceae bacterium]